MRGEAKKSIAVLILLIASAILGNVLVPKPVPISEQPNLEAMIPRQFGEWSIDPSIVPILPSPDQQQQLSETYDQMVNRTYVDGRGRRVMVSIAYGSRQDQKLKAHRQEVCYSSQGFQIRNIRHKSEKIGGVDIILTQMFAVSGQREEPVTYWFTVGNQVVQSHLQRLIAQLQYGLGGTIPDGVLVRVSTLQPDSEHAYQEHIEFINTLLVNMTPEAQQRLVGSLTR